MVLRPVKAMLDRNFRCTVTEYVLVPCSMSKPRAKSVNGSRARVHTDQADLWLGQPVAALSRYNPTTDPGYLPTDVLGLTTHVKTFGLVLSFGMEMDKYDFDGRMEGATIFRIDCAKIPEFWLEVDVSKLPIEEDKEEKDKGESKKNGKKKQGDCAYADPFGAYLDPFEALDEDQIDDCITELYECDDLNGELEQGYDCTYEQALYWLKNKYIEETSYGEDLYNRIKKEIKKKVKKARKN